MTECEDFEILSFEPFTNINNDKNWRGIFATRT